MQRQPPLGMPCPPGIYILLRTAMVRVRQALPPLLLFGFIVRIVFFVRSLFVLLKMRSHF